MGLASSFGPAVTILVAVAFLGERLRPDPVVRAGRRPRRDDRDRAAVGTAAQRREAEPEPRQAVARLRADPATALLDELLDDGQSDAGAPARAIARLLDPIEALEDPIDVLGRDPSPVFETDTSRSPGRRSALTVIVPPEGV